jgi:hypothetical protein
MNIITSVYHSIRWKRSDSYCASKLALSLENYKKIKGQILKILNDPSIGYNYENIVELLNSKIDVSSVTKKKISSFKSKVSSVEENIEKGTAIIKGVSSVEPRTAEEIEEVLKLDKSKWKLTSYWNKEHQGYWLISANVSRIKNDDLSQDNVEEILKNVFNEPLKDVVINPITTDNHKALFVYLSDRHIAASVDNTAVYENSYDAMNYKLRLQKVEEEIQYLQGLYGKFSDLFIIDLGDKMDGLNGYTTRGGHKLPQNMSNREAFETAVRVEKEFIDNIYKREIANFYHVIQNCNSNHGGDFDYMVNRALEIYINGKYPHINTRMLNKFIETVYYGVHAFLFTHGKDTEDLKHGLPLHLNDKTENYINKYLMHNKIDTEKYVVSLVKGDLHKDTSEESYGFRYRNVLSLFGGSKWIGTNFGPCKPGCSFDIVEAHTPRIYQHKIFL